MARYQIILAYDGTHFNGYQRQTSAITNEPVRTVQAEVEAGLRRLGWSGSVVLAAGRTDTGVHATGQVIAFDLEWTHSPNDLRNALNAYLPADIAIRQVCPVLPGFHPRFAACYRRYQYRLFCDEVRDPLRERYAWRVWPEVELSRMQRAASYLPGRHDFAAFGSPMRKGGSTMRSIASASWHEINAEFVFDIAGDAFLYHMVRRLVSLQVEIGQGRLDQQAVDRYLQGKEHPAHQGLAPAHGLTLVEVAYPPDLLGEEDLAPKNE